MNGYGQFCPIAKASEVVSERWTILVIRELGAGSDSFNDLRKGLPLMSPSLLSTRLKSLERAGVIDRRQNSKGVRYQLTEAGEELATIVWQLGTWGQRWIRSKLGKDDLDPSLLMWDIHRTMKTDYFKARRTTLLFEFSDYTSKLRRWWLVVTNGEVDVCMKDPGYNVDLHITSSVKTLTRYWMGDISMSKALREKLMNLSGDAGLKRDIKQWLRQNYYADVSPGKK